MSVNYGVNTKFSWTATAGTTIYPSCALAFDDHRGEGSSYTYVNGKTSGEDFTFIHKRKGFPSGKYIIVVDFWYDETYVFINDFPK